MIIVDVESSGVDPVKCSLVSVGALDFDNPKNRFYEECRVWDGAHIEDGALKVNGFTREEIEVPKNEDLFRVGILPKPPSFAKATEGFSFDIDSRNKPRRLLAKEKQTDREVVEKFLKWVESCKEHTLAGQNPSFDRDFLMHTAYRYHINWTLAHRTIDIHSVAYFHMLKNGITPPIDKDKKHSALNLTKIIKYVGLEIERGKHNAMEDTLLEAEVLSRLMFDKPLLPEYEKFPMGWKNKEI